MSVMSINTQVNQLLDSEWRRQWLSVSSRVDDDSVLWLQDFGRANSGFQAQLEKVWSCSEYVANYATVQPNIFSELVASGDLQRSYPSSHFSSRLAKQGEEFHDEAQWSILLRHFRNREMMRIVWRDFCGLADLVETTADMSALAAACLDVPLQFLHQQACQLWGIPVGKHSAVEQHLIVLGMGKLGAAELNVSSDIDLMFVYPEGGETTGGSRKRNLSNQEFFERIGRSLIQLLDNRTAEGFVFRVDMRLRPYGRSGPLVGSFDAMETYYQTQGRDWERFAMVKAKPIAGDIDMGERLLETLRPFTYRKYLDFSAIHALRDIKAMIEQEVLRTNACDDVKRGRGGIREVEFIAQAFQLIRGGRDSRLRNPAIKVTLPLLEQEGALAVGKAQQLYAAYTFLRRVEHVIQGIGDVQSQKLPESELDRARMVAVLNCADWHDFRRQLDAHRDLIQQEFAEVVAEPDAENNSQVTALEQKTQQLWQLLVRQQHSDDESLVTQLQALKFEQPQQAQVLLSALVSAKAVQVMQASARQRLDVLMPKLLAGCAAADNNSVLLPRVLQLIEAVVRRSAYLVLLTENPLALQQLLILCAASPWIAEQISRYPALLDELLDPQALYKPRDKTQLSDELRQHILRIPEEDLETQLEALRYFKLSNSLRVAACEVTDALPLMQVSDNLTWIAEVILDQVLALAWAQMTLRHGQPGQSQAGQKPGFLIVGYGKLGGIELGHNSDLDLVFVHNAKANAYSEGERSVDNATFFARLGQKIIHMLGAQTASGMLYEVDMRLRPSGNSGMLVTSLAAFKKYQMEEAWTWEHQALLRARAVAGDTELAKEFQQIRHAVLCRQRDTAVLAQQVRDMRLKMADHLLVVASQADVNNFDLKQGRGGIVDIEFLVQFIVLAEAQDHPELTTWSDNIRLLDVIAVIDLLAKEEAEGLKASYRRYRALGHRAQLQKFPVVVNAGQLEAERRQVIAIWNRLLSAY